MVILFGDLTGIEDHGSARLVFRSIINQRTRIDIMKSMLERAPQHKTKGQFFDDLIREYSSLAGIRNDYAHGLWYTHEDRVRAYLETETEAYDTFLDKREVTVKELEGVWARIMSLLGDLLDRKRQLEMIREIVAQPLELQTLKRGLPNEEGGPRNEDEPLPHPPQSSPE